MDILHTLIIGAGPGGLASAVALIDENIYNFFIVDPEFQVGALFYYQNIPANTKIKILNTSFINSKHFNKAKYIEPYDNLDVDKTHSLGLTFQSLKLLSEDLLKICNWKKGKVTNIIKESEGSVYKVLVLTSENEIIQYMASNIILATGGIERSLEKMSPHTMYSQNSIKILNLIHSLDTEKSKELYQDGDILAIVGSSHSAILAAMNACKSGKQVEIHIFMKSSLKFAVWVNNSAYLYNGTGLKGEVAKWCKENMVKNLLSNIHIHFIGGGDEEFLYSSFLPKCNKILYALGFKPNNNIQFKFQDQEVTPLNFDFSNQKILFDHPLFDNIYGIGLPYPKLLLDLCGDYEGLVSIRVMFSQQAPDIVKEIKKNT